MSLEERALEHLLRLARDGRPDAAIHISIAPVKGPEYEQSMRLAYLARMERFSTLASGWAAVVADADTLASKRQPDSEMSSDNWQSIREFATVSLPSMPLMPLTLMVPAAKPTAALHIYFLCLVELDDRVFCAMVQAEVHPEDAKLIASHGVSMPDGNHEEVQFLSPVTFCPRETFEPYAAATTTTTSIVADSSAPLTWPNIRCRASRVPKPRCIGMQFVPMALIPAVPRERLEEYTERYVIRKQ